MLSRNPPKQSSGIAPKIAKKDSSYIFFSENPSRKCVIDNSKNPFQRFARPVFEIFAVGFPNKEHVSKEETLEEPLEESLEYVYITSI